MTNALEQTEASLVQVPWMQDPETRAYLGVLGAAKDVIIDQARVGVKMRYPGGPRMQAAQDGLPIVNERVVSAVGDPKRLSLLGSTFALARLGSMSDAEYEQYLESAWAVWGLGGTIESIFDALTACGLPQIEIVEEWQDPLGSWSNPAGGYGWRFCIILGPDYGSLGWSPMGSPLPGPVVPVLGIAGMTANQLADIARLVRMWKTAAATPVKLVFRFASGGNVSPVCGAAGLPNPIPSGPPAVVFHLTGHYWNEVGAHEGLHNPLVSGPVYLLDGTSRA